MVCVLTTAPTPARLTWRFMIENAQLVGGRWVRAARGERTAVLAPADGRTLGTVPYSRSEDVDAAVDAAGRAARDWARTPPGERAAALLALADAMERDEGTLAQLESRNAGKPVAAAAGEVTRSADRLRFFAGAARSVRGLPAAEYTRGTTSFVRREPLGVAGLITPWNYPLHMAVWKIGPALAAGNTCVVKPSELTPLSTLELARLSEGILPPGVLNVVCGDSVAGAALAAHRGIAVVSVTGEVSTGRAVAHAAAESLRRTHLELGGKAPAVVLADASPAALAAGLRIGSFWNGGQDCTAAARVIVDTSLYDPVVEALVEMARGIRVGDPADPATEMGPLISPGHRDRVQGFVERARKNGARVLAGGGDGDLGPAFFEPTVITGVEQHDEIVQREVFGPVITVQRAADPGEALRLANDVPYGLAASAWTNDLEQALTMSHDLEFGTVWINEHGPVASEAPFGGFGDSGHGTDLSVYALDEYTRVKHVMVALTSRRTL
jgi:betaine-aldehyde dehydrogenase/aminobutyraldehyde dehydrogenase